MKKLLICLLLTPFLALGQEKGKAFKVSGKMDRMAMKVEWVFMQYRMGGEWKTDSFKLAENSYSTRR